MKLILARILLSFCLLASAGASVADNSTDYFLQNDLAVNDAENPDGLSDHYQQYIDWLLEQGYSPASIIMSSVGRGLTLADVIFLMSRSQPENAKNYFHTAEALAPSLPGWVCSSANAMGHRYDKPIDSNSVEDSTTVEQVASLYFDEHERFVKTPDWQGGIGHISAKVEELIKYKELEIEQISDEKDNPVDSWWYLPQGSDDHPVMVVGLYPEERRILIDGRLVELQALAQKGVESIQVMFMYNDNGHIPISDVEHVPGEVYGGSSMKDDQVDYIDYDDGEITASEVINRFEADGGRVPPARDWRIGDHHLMVRTEELVELFDIPEKEDIDPTFWHKSVERLSMSTIDPLHLTLVQDAKGERWLDESSLVSVAREMGVERLPVVFFYHGIDRQPCGMPSACLSDIKAAAEAGSGGLNLFDKPGGMPPYRDPPGIIERIPGSISPN